MQFVASCSLTAFVRFFSHFSNLLLHTSTSLIVVYKHTSKMAESLSFRGTLKGHSDWVTSIATTSEDPNLVLSSSRDKSVLVW